MLDQMILDASPEARRAYVRFKTASLDFAVEPNRANFARYRAASRALEFRRHADALREAALGEPPAAA
jgi:hypothetical protein